MSDDSIVTQLPLLPEALLPPKKGENERDWHYFWLHPEELPAMARTCPTTLRLLDLLGPLHWNRCPERNLHRNWGQPTIPFKALLAAELIKLNEGLVSLCKLREFLLEHPPLISLAGFPLVPAPHTALGFNALASLPTLRHFARMLRQTPNALCQFLLAETVQVILAVLQQICMPAPDCVSVDTKHILAWVKENNPKAYVPDRYNKLKQPPGDPDCRLGCKRQHNRFVEPPTPTHNPVPGRTVKVGEYYWGYGSGVVVAKVPDWGEFVVAELTQPFDQGDLSYFYPLMQRTEANLGYRPRVGTFDAGFDAWYVYAYFHKGNDDPGAFAAVPFSEKGGYKLKDRHFTPEGLPLCAAGLAMPLRFTYTDRTSCLVEHERGKYVCPLQRLPPADAPRPTRCPVRHPNWSRGGCTAMMPTSIGARLRYTLDREGEPYQAAYRQRTAVERINSQATALGIERPHLRNGAAIANQNTLIYTLINLRFLRRLGRRQQEGA